LSVLIVSLFLVDQAHTLLYSSAMCSHSGHQPSSTTLASWQRTRDRSRRRYLIRIELDLSTT